MKQLCTKNLLVMVMSVIGANAFAQDIEVVNSDGVTLYYNFVEDGNGLEVTCGQNEYKGDIVIPESVEYEGKKYTVSSIGPKAFYFCNGLTTVTIGNSVKSIMSSAFAYSNLTLVNIPGSVTYIGEEAFRDCVGLSAVNISDLSAWCSIKFGSDGNPLIWAGHLRLNGDEITDLVIPNDVTNISNHAFECCEGLTSVTIPNNVIEIGDYAFYGCYNLIEASISNSVTTIGEYVFSCSGLTSLTIPNSVTTIGYKAFYRCSELTSVIIPNSVSSIGMQAFEDCSSLISLTIPGSVKSVRESTFALCSNLTSLTIMEGVEKIGKSAFFYCRSLSSVEFPNSITYIGDGAFDSCTRLSSVTLSNRLSYVGKDAFGGNYMAVNISDLASWCSINFGEGGNPLSRLGHLLLNGEEIKDLVIPNGVTSIGNRAFQNLTGLNSVDIPSSVTSIGISAFMGCSGLTTLAIPNSVTSIGDGSFSGCVGLTSLVIPNSVTSIGSAAFSYCKGLTSLTISDGVNTINSRAFYGCTGLNSIIIPNSVTSIGNNAFDGIEFSTVVSLIEKPFVIGTGSLSSFSEKTFENATLYVPVGTKDMYKARKGWKSFYNIVEGTGGIDGFAIVRTNNVNIQVNGSALAISGVEVGTAIKVYDMTGRMVGSAIASAGTTYLGTSLQSGEFVIVKIGEETVKVVIK